MFRVFASYRTEKGMKKLCNGIVARYKAYIDEATGDITDEGVTRIMVEKKKAMAIDDRSPHNRIAISPKYFVKMIETITGRPIHEFGDLEGKQVEMHKCGNLVIKEYDDGKGIVKFMSKEVVHFTISGHIKIDKADKEGLKALTFFEYL